MFNIRKKNTCFGKGLEIRYSEDDEIFNSFIFILQESVNEINNEKYKVSTETIITLLKRNEKYDTDTKIYSTILLYDCFIDIFRILLNYSLTKEYCILDLERHKYEKEQIKKQIEEDKKNELYNKTLKEITELVEKELATLPVIDWEKEVENQ